MRAQTVWWKKVLLALRRYICFFLLMSFVLSCCMVLFLNELTAAVGLVLTQDEIERAAKLTFLNVLFLSFLCTVIDELRRKWMVDRPVKRILSAAEKIMQGDLSARVQLPKRIDTMSDFNIVIDYFNRMAEELSGMETLRTDFIANVSHELKTPLSVIQNYATMLAQPNLPEEKRREYAGSIAAASRRLANLITNILKLNKLENQQLFPAVQAYDLGEQLCTCLLDFENAWEGKRLEIETDIAQDVTVRTDPELLSLVWNNLFSNAIKFTQPGGKVSLSLKTEGEFAVVRISDTGCGISEEVGRHIFEKFYQGDPSHAAQGNGLGLALVKRVIDITGADISVESQVGVGSTFTVRLRRGKDGTAQANSV